MSEKRKTDFTLNRLDDLFTSQSERENGLTPTIKDIPLEKLVPFTNHPFKVRDDEEMNKLVESVYENGVLVPAIVREKDNGDYEIISGHRRKFASEIAGKSTLRCIISNLDDDAATVIMVDSNIQRENILPSEKAFAYKMKLDAMKHQGKSFSTSRHFGEKLLSIAEESIRLGLSSKCMIVVPNHLTEQWGADILTLYPNAKVLVATKKDFEKKNRKRFLSRIATGDYDLIVIGHSQFEKVPMSIERQQAILQRQLDEIIEGISELKYKRGQNFTVKQLEKAKKSIQAKLDKLNDQSRKDDIVTFEELGVDRLFIDEAHYFKNRAKRCV